MSQFPEHVDAIQRELSQLHQQIQQNKERIEQMKSENAVQSKQVQSMIEQHQNGTRDCGSAQKHQEKLMAFQAQYLPMVSPEIQMLMTSEIEKAKQQLQVEFQASVMNGMMGGVHMPAAAMMMAQAAQAQAVQAAAQAQHVAAAQSQARTNMMGVSPRMAKPNGMPNGMSAMQSMNGMAAMAMQNQMMAHMPPSMAQQLQAMAAFSGMGMGMPPMPGFSPAQMAALQGMNGMPHHMMPPMSASNQAAAAAMAQAAAMAPHMNLSVSTPSRNHSSGPLSGTRTPQSMNSPRPTHTQPKEEHKERSPTEDKKQISPASDDTVAVS
ncbi:unnamed protein product [Auanema sp. JU1783]|nr:unnamed protein product [Auanema sp. JU1783]